MAHLCGHSHVLSRTAWAWVSPAHGHRLGDENSARLTPSSPAGRGKNSDLAAAPVLRF